MSAIVKGTTPVLTLLVPGVNLKPGNHMLDFEVYVSSEHYTMVFTQSNGEAGATITPDGDSLVQIMLSEQQTLALREDKYLEFQVRWNDGNGLYATDVSDKMEVKRLLYPYKMNKSGEV